MRYLVQEVESYVTYHVRNIGVKRLHNVLLIRTVCGVLVASFVGDEVVRIREHVGVLAAQTTLILISIRRFGISRFFATSVLYSHTL